MLHEGNEHKIKEIIFFILGKYSLENLSNWEGEDPFIARLFTIEIIIWIKLITNVNQSSKTSYIMPQERNAKVNLSTTQKTIVKS